jgi:hypothetical protein
MVTETAPVKAALDELRAELGDDRLDFGELVVLGANAKAEALRRSRPDAIEARRWLAERVRRADLPVDPSAADAAKRHGLIDPDAAA